MAQKQKQIPSTPSSQKAPFVPHNKGKIIGAKDIFTPDQIQMLKLRLAQEDRDRDWLLLSLGINGRLREGDLLNLKVDEVATDAGIKAKVAIRTEKREVVQEFSIPKDTQERLKLWIDDQSLQPWDYLFYGRKNTGKPMSKRQLLNLVKGWASMIGLDPKNYGTHSLRRSGADYLYRRTNNLRAVQIALAHASIETTIRYLGVDRREVLELSEMYPL